MAEQGYDRDKPRIRVQSYEIPVQEGVSTEEARTLIEQALRAIPDEDLAKFRAGHVTIIM